jgi:hypothetical protein
VTAVEEQLAWEAEQRPRAAAAAITAGVFTLAGNILLAVLFRNGPGEEDGFISLSESLDARLQGGAPQEQSLLVRQADYYADNVVPFILATLLTALAAVLAALTLAYLYRATAARAPETGRLPIVMTVIGAVSFFVGHTVRDLAIFIGAAGFADDTDRSADATRDVLQSDAVLVADLIRTIGLFALGVAFALIALNAMRAGLLTRFLGILGVIVGVLTVFAAVDQPQIVRTFWLIAVGLVIAGRTGRGLLPAWQTGRAEPWPSRQQLIEQREAAQPGRAPAREPEPEPAGEGAVSAREAKRKRKRRR